MRARVAGWVSIPKGSLPPGRPPLIRERLTIIPKRTSEYQEDILPLRVYAEDEECIRVPREWFFRHMRESYNLEWDVAEGEPIPEERARLADTIVGPDNKERPFRLREEQSEALEHVLGLYRASGGESPRSLGVSLQAPTAWGKTIWASALISSVRRKAVVLVHREFLLNQWKQRLGAVMPGLRVGVIQGDRADLDADVCVGMMQSLSAWAQEMEAHGYFSGKGPEDWRGRVRFPPGMVRAFGLLFVDECHRAAAPTWVPVAPLFDARFRVGITATPRRKDGCEDAFFWHLGGVGFVGRERQLTPLVRRVKTGWALQRRGGGTPRRSILFKILCADKFRNRAIADQLAQAVAKGRKCMVLSVSLKHLDNVRDAFAEVRERLGVPAGATVDYYVGGRKQEELDVAGTADVVLATYQMAAEGLDLPWLDTLFLATPKSDVEQAVGRICRPFEGKKAPIVVDFIDEEPDLLTTLKGRERFYQKFGTPLVVRRRAV